MRAVFGRGTLYTADGRRLLADVYYFIQPKTCLSAAQDQLQGFIDPILEYSALNQIPNWSRRCVMQLDDGTRVHILLDKGYATSSQFPLFFSSCTAEGSPFTAPDEIWPVDSPKRQVRPLPHSI